MPLALLHVDLEGSPVLVQARRKPGLLGVAHCTGAEVQAGRAELEGHLGELVIREYACRFHVRFVIQVSLSRRLHHNDIFWVKLQVFTDLSHIYCWNLRLFYYTKMIYNYYKFI